LPGSLGLGQQSAIGQPQKPRTRKRMPKAAGTSPALLLPMPQRLPPSPQALAASSAVHMTRAALPKQTCTPGRGWPQLPIEPNKEQQRH